MFAPHSDRRDAPGITSGSIPLHLSARLLLVAWSFGFKLLFSFLNLLAKLFGVIVAQLRASLKISLSSSSAWRSTSYWRTFIFSSEGWLLTLDF